MAYLSGKIQPLFLEQISDLILNFLRFWFWVCFLFGWFCFFFWRVDRFLVLSLIWNHYRSAELKAQSPCGYWKVFMDPINSINLLKYFFFFFFFGFGCTPSNLVTCRGRNSVTEFWWQQEIAVSLLYDFRKIHPQIILELRKMKKYKE